MVIKIIDNRKVDITEDEARAYEKICQSYDDPPAMKGKDLFAGLFETNDEGIIIFLKPPHNRMCTFEVYLFLMSLMQHQHLRVMHKIVAEAAKKIDEKLKMVDEALSHLDEKKKTKTKDK